MIRVLFNASVILSELKTDYLVSLDKKHVLAQKNTIQYIHIVDPGELIHIVNTI